MGIPNMSDLPEGDPPLPDIDDDPPPSDIADDPPLPNIASFTSRISIAIGVGVGIGLLAMGIFIFWYKIRKRRRGRAGSYDHEAPPQGPTDDDLVDGQCQHLQQSSANLYRVGGPPPPSVTSSSSFENQLGERAPQFGFGFSNSTFTYEELALATDGFSNTNFLGQGGFGYVHKGVLPNGEEVAIKQLKVGNGQGEREFQAEVEIISRVNHKHLVSLVGYCSSGAQRILVFEFVPNNTMEFHLNGAP